MSKYNKPITIINPLPVGKDEDGFPVISEPGIIRECWAEVKTTSGMTMIKNGANFEKSYVRFVVRYSSAKIESGMQIRYNGDLYNIEFANDINAEHKEIEIQAVKVVN